MSWGPRILFVSLLDDGGSDRIVAEMGRLGAYCMVVAPPDAFATRTRFARRVFPLPRRGGWTPRAFVMGLRLESILREAAPDLIIPIDDLAARALRDERLLSRLSPAARGLIEHAFGDPSSYNTIISRQATLRLAQRLGVRVPNMAVVARLDEARRAAARIGYPVVLKRELSCGGTGVSIVDDEPALIRAFRVSWRRAQMKRWLSFVPGFWLPEPTALTMQAYIPGELAFRVSACVDGEETDGVNFVAERANPRDTAASSRIRCLAQSEMEGAAREIVAALKVSGLISMDFIVTPANEAYLIELNARPIACSHLGRLFGHDVLSAALERRRVGVSATARPPRAVALFPRALDSDPANSDLVENTDRYHDVPWDDPEVVAVYSDWLDARHPEARPVMRRFARA